jgi:hypothetical protein
VAKVLNALKADPAVKKFIAMCWGTLRRIVLMFAAFYDLHEFNA